MSLNLKDKILEFAEIAKACPENLQERCFVLLLEDFLVSRAESREPKTKKEHSAVETPKVDSAQVTKVDEPKANGVGGSQEDFVETDLHVKARKFLKDQTLTIEHINEIFYKEGGVAKPLYEDLKSTRMAECQIRVALLQSLKNALFTGEFEFDGESVRTEVEMRKCYDPGNFAANFKNNKSLFDGFEKYDKTSPKLKLSSEGRVALAAAIKQLQ